MRAGSHHRRCLPNGTDDFAPVDFTVTKIIRRNYQNKRLKKNSTNLVKHWHQNPTCSYYYTQDMTALQSQAALRNL
jgi:hypothetical protein